MIRWLLAALLLVSAPAGAAWPDRPVRWLVGLPAGASPDLLSRLLAQRLQAESGQPVVVENRPGAAGNLAAQALARAPADGSTIGTLFGATLSINHHLYPHLGFDAARDLAPVAEFARYPALVLVNPGVPATDLAGLQAWVRAQPQPPLCATGGAGLVPHLATVALLRRWNLSCDVIHYRGSPDALRDVLAGRVPLMLDAAPSALPLARDGKLRALAVTGSARSPLAPDLPAVAETLPGFEALSWLAVGGPAGLPEAVAARLEALVAAAAADPAFHDRLASLGAEAVSTPRAPLALRIAAEDARWGALIAAAGITAE
jgi:tripartite-type tricarboxylate transporter receptor subunit TctC